MSSIIDEIRNRQSQPPVEERADILVSTNVESGSQIQPEPSQLDVLTASKNRIKLCYSAGMSPKIRPIKKAPGTFWREVLFSFLFLVGPE